MAPLQALGASSGVAVIFMYHHVSSTVQPGPYARALTLTPAEFAHQLSWLRTHGCETLTVDTLLDDVHAGSLRGCEVALTFDDGYDDAANVVLPLLQDAGDSATFYVSSGFVGQPGHISRTQLKELAAAGMQIGAHTVTHADLTTLRDAAARREIEQSGQALTRWSGMSVDSFAYPAGQYNAGVEALVRNAGYRNALTTQPGRLSFASLADALALPRYRIEHGTGGALIERVVGPATRTGRTPAELSAIARERAEGNDPDLAERIGAALLNASYPEQLLKVRVLRAPSVTVVGLMLSAVKFHERVNRAQFEDDVAGMIERVLDAQPDVGEVDVWAVAPLAPQPLQAVSGDYAAPTTSTVFSVAVTRAMRQSAVSRLAMLGTIYWEAAFLKGTPTR